MIQRDQRYLIVHVALFRTEPWMVLVTITAGKRFVSKSHASPLFRESYEVAGEAFTSCIVALCRL